jgi:hypothetical protein
MKSTIDMAREAGFDLAKVFVKGVLVEDATTELKAFEALVRADEREACAKVCESIELDGYPTIEQQQCADAIRERSANARAREDA